MTGAAKLTGTCELTFRGTDEADHTSEVSRTVTLDNTGPTVATVTPAARALVRGTFDATASGVGDPAGIDQVDLYANGAYVASDATSPYRIPVRTGSRSGKLTLTWQVYDKVSNRTTVVRPSRPTTRRRRCRSPRDRRTRRR